MPSYFLGILTAFAPPVFHGWSNVLDHYFTGKVFEQRSVLVFISSVIAMLLLPIVWLFGAPSLVSPLLLGLLLCIALTEFAYIFPYYWALGHADTSIVASLFSLGKVFIPLLAFVFLGERLTAYQYAGFFMLIASSVLLTVDFRRWQFSKAFWLMAVASLLLALQAILIKYAYSLGISWGALVTWMTVFEFLLASLTMTVRANRQALGVVLQTLDGKWPLFLQLELTGWLGSMGSYYSLSLIPVTVAKAIASTQPVFPLIYALLFSKKYPHLFREYIGRDGVWKKVLLFVCIAAGTILII